MHTLRIGHIEPNAHIYGPGQRFAIWVQGCTLACKGCWNQQFWGTEGGTLQTIDQLMEKIQATPGTEGITLLGGEPLQQAEGVRNLIQRCKELDYSIFLYTGYEIKEFDDVMQNCFDLSDIVITGRYAQSRRNTSLRWRGSTNQIVHFPTERYRDFDFNEAREIEIHIEDGGMSIYGYPTEAEIKLIKGEST